MLMGVVQNYPSMRQRLLIRPLLDVSRGLGICRVRDSQLEETEIAADSLLWWLQRLTAGDSQPQM